MSTALQRRRRREGGEQPWRGLETCGLCWGWALGGEGELTIVITLRLSPPRAGRCGCPSDEH